MVSLSSCVLCTFFACAACEMQGDVSAVDLGRTVADIAQRVAEDDGYGVAFAGDLSKALHGETAIASHAQRMAPTIWSKGADSTMRPLLLSSANGAGARIDAAWEAMEL